MTVVFSADLLASGLVEPNGATVLRLWGEHAIRPALNRPLLVRYLRVLKAMGLSSEQLRWWGWWLTTPDTAQFVQDEPGQTTNHREECEYLAGLVGAEVIIAGTTLFGAKSGPASDLSDVSWESPGEFVRRF